MIDDDSSNSITKKRISQPPLNLLFNPSLIDRQDVWQIDIVKLLENLLELLTATGNRDLRVCGGELFLHLLFNPSVKSRIDF